MITSKDAASLKEMFEGVKVRFAVGRPIFTRRMAINLADMLGTEVKPLILRLEREGLLKSGSWEWFRANGGFTKNHYIEARASQSK